MHLMLFNGGEVHPDQWGLSLGFDASSPTSSHGGHDSPKDAAKPLFCCVSSLSMCIPTFPLSWQLQTTFQSASSSSAWWADSYWKLRQFQPRHMPNGESWRGWVFQLKNGQETLRWNRIQVDTRTETAFIAHIAIPLLSLVALYMRSTVLSLLSGTGCIFEGVISKVHFIPLSMIFLLLYLQGNKRKASKCISVFWLFIILFTLLSFPLLLLCLLIIFLVLLLFLVISSGMLSFPLVELFGQMLRNMLCGIWPLLLVNVAIKDVENLQLP